MRVSWILLVSSLPFTSAYLRLKFRHWWPRYEKHWIAETPQCMERLEAYWQDNRTQCQTPCACAADCFLQNVSGTIQSNFASAQVLLGLLPSILVFVGPTIGEVAVLSTYRPLLAGLLVLGSPATNVIRTLNQVDVSEPVTQHNSNTIKRCLNWAGRQNVVFQAVLRALSYIAALMAITNNILNSVHLDLRTICGWRCGALFMPLGWSLAAIIVHIPGMIAIRLRLSKNYSPSIWSTLQSNTYRRVKDGRDGIHSDALFAVTSVFAVVHLIFGILDLSSLIFISATEALRVFVRYAMSALLCQFVVLLELANMRRDLALGTGSHLRLEEVPQPTRPTLSRVHSA